MKTTILSPKILICITGLLSMPGIALASPATLNLHLTSHFLGYLSLIVFFLAYLLVMCEELTRLRKSKPVMLTAGILWLIVAIASRTQHQFPALQAAINYNLLEYANLLLFLFVAMTYINVLTERGVFAVLCDHLLSKGYSYRRLFWITGGLAFILSPIADNLTTALVLCVVILGVGKANKKFVSIACINIVVAANAGGAFSPFGDITTLMVWQKHILPFFDFFKIYVPALANFLIPAFIMNFALPSGKPIHNEQTSKIKCGAILVSLLFLITIVTTVLFHQLFHLPSTVGMMFGLGYLQILSYFIHRYEKKTLRTATIAYRLFDIFRQVSNIEWDTLLFFYGVILSVGALASLGYLALGSDYFYQQLGTHLPTIYQATPANILVGLASSIVDNIPIMFAVLTMHPAMSEGQWLLVTLTAGVGGSLLSIGSAAGVALMGQARSIYTFLSHFKWSWAILIGYIIAILLHLWMNNHLFYVYN